VERIKAWALGESWEVKVDEDQAKAALKIQGQARRRRDTRKVLRVIIHYRSDR